MLDAIIFDIGNVLLRVDFGRTMERLAPYCDVDMSKIMFELEPLKEEYEGGLVTNDVFLDRATELLGYRGDRRHLIAAWQEIFRPIEETEDLVKQLVKKEIPLFLLSNTNGLHAKYFLASYPVFSHFKGAVYSHKAQLMKPDQAIYEYAIVEFGVNPKRTLFIDDLAPNVVAARETGFHAHQYAVDRHEELLKVIRGHGIEVYGLND